MKQYEYPLPPRCSVKTVTLRQTFGRDEDEAELAAEMSGASPKKELVGLAIVAVDGAPVMPGDSGWEKWSTRTRQTVTVLHERLNGYKPEEIRPLIEKAENEDTEIVDGQVRIRYGFPPGCGFEFVVFREMMEPDERAASAKGAQAADEMMRRCIVSTDRGDEPLTLADLKALDTKTRNILSTYWAGMNFVDPEEIDPLASAAEAAADAIASTRPSASSTESGSLQSGSGSHPQVGAA